LHLGISRLLIFEFSEPKLLAHLLLKQGYKQSCEQSEDGKNKRKRSVLQGSETQNKNVPTSFAYWQTVEGAYTVW
ncbi:MAG: hypothetical protein ACTS5R_02025, partial [Candidatus Hodgkinia cicadicola]